MTVLITAWVFFVLGVIAFVIEVWGLVDGATRPSKPFVTAEKRSKVFWVGLMVAGAVFGYLSIPSVPFFGILIGGGGLPTLFMILAVLPAAIYLADVKPEVVRYTPRRGR